MEERSKHLIDLFHFALSGVQEKIDLATAELTNAYNQIELIADFFLIAQNCSEPIIRKCSAIAIRRMILINQFDQEQINFMKINFLLLIQNDPDFLNKQAYIHAALELQKTLVEPWEDLYNLGMAFLSKPETLNFGLQVWSSIVDITPEILLLQYFERLMNCIISTFEIPNVDILISSIRLFSMLTQKIDISLFDQFQNIPQLFLNEAQACIKDHPNIIEAQTIFWCIQDQLKIKNEGFLSIAENFVELSLQIISSDISPELRSACYPIIVIAPMLFPETVESQLPIYLQSVLSLAVQLLLIDRELISHEVDFVSEFVYSMIINTESSYDVLQGILTFAKNNLSSEETGPISIQVAFLALESIARGAVDDFFDIDPSESVGHIILFALSSNDPFVFESCCEFLISAAVNCPYVYQEFYDSLVAALFSKISEECALKTLDEVISNSNQLPANFMALLQQLASILGSCHPMQYEMVISCMTSIISQISDVNAEVYGNMRQILISLLSSENVDTQTSAKIFQCFGQLAKVAPLDVQNDVPELMKVMLHSMEGNFDDIQLNGNIAECIQNLAKVIPMSVQPYLGSIVPMFMNLLARDNPETGDDEDNEEEDFNPSQITPISMKCYVLECLSELISDLPNEMSSTIPDVISAVSRFLEQNDEITQMSAAKSILLMIDGLRLVSYDLTNLLTNVVDEIPKSPHPQVLNSLFNSLGTLISNVAYESLSGEIVNSVIRLFQQIFDGTLDNVYSSAKVLNQEIVNSLFFSLRMFVLTLGENIQRNSIADMFVSFLCPHLNVKKNIIKAYVANIYGSMFFAAPQLKQIGQSAIEICFKTMTKKNDFVNNILLSTLNYIINADKNLFNDHQINMIKSQCNAIIANRENMDSFVVSTAITTWCSIVAAFGVTPNQNELEIILNLLPPVVDDDDIPFTARFIVFAAHKWPQLVHNHIHRIAANVFASGEWCLRLVPLDVMNALASVLAVVGQDHLQVLVKYNQHYVLQIQSNLSRFSHPS